MGYFCPPASWEGTQSFSVPWYPMPRQGLHPVPAGQEPGLGGGLLHLPGEGATGGEDRVA